MKVISPTNTAKQADDDPLGTLADAMVRGPSRSIEHMEAVGQREFLASDVLPTDGIERARATLEAWGFVIGAAIPGDPIFTQARLPEGWRRGGTDHAMWSKILDAEGRERVSVFYKAAFYDRSAHLSLCSRFVVSQDFDSVLPPGTIAIEVKDAGRVVRSASVEYEGAQYGDDWRAKYDGLRADLCAWCAEEYGPEWDKPGAWDLPTGEVR